MVGRQEVIAIPPSFARVRHVLGTVHGAPRGVSRRLSLPVSPFPLPLGSFSRLSLVGLTPDTHGDHLALGPWVFAPISVHRY